MLERTTRSVLAALMLGLGLVAGPAASSACGTVINFTSAYLAGIDTPGLDTEQHVRCRFATAAALMCVSSGYLSQKDARGLLRAVLEDAAASTDARVACLGKALEAHFKSELTRIRRAKVPDLAPFLPRARDFVAELCAPSELEGEVPRIVLERADAAPLRPCFAGP